MEPEEMMKDRTRDMNTSAQEFPASSNKKKEPFYRGIGVRMVLCIIILALGIVGANFLVRSAPKANRRPPAKMMPLVKVQAVHPVSHRLIVSAMGSVVPARELILKARVSGEIVNIHPEFTEGGFILKGTEILAIDDTDYKLAFARKQSVVVNARYALKLEQGHQEVARREWSLLNGKNETSSEDAELALRKPHLQKVEADLEAAEADLEQAKLDWERTKIRAPFNAIVRSTSIEIGSQISSQESLGDLVGTDEYWIKASVPLHRLQWISIPRNGQGRGATARVIYRDGAKRVGVVFKLLGDLETEGRMARVLISVPDPLGIKDKHKGPPPLLIGEYVRVEIEGQQIDHVYRIPRTALRDGEFVWIATPNGTLEIRQVPIFWRDKDAVLIKEGLHPGERVVVSDLSTPVTGMELKVETSDPRALPSDASPSSPRQG